MWPRWIFDGPPPFFQQLPDQVLTGNQAVNTTFVSRGGDFLLTGLVAQSTGTFLSRLNATWEGNYLDNGKCRSANLWGTAQYPTWIRPKFIPANSTLAFELTDVSGSGNTIRITLLGRSATADDKKRWGRGRGFFVMNSDPVDAGIVLTANQSLIQSIQVEDAFNFRCDAAVHIATSTNYFANLLYRDVRNQMTIRLANDKVIAANLFGVQNLPFVFQSPPVFYKQSTLGFDVQDNSGSPNTLRPMLVGERLDSDNPDDWGV
jgi:hypothetical protein